ncbi:LysR family transcriptional regulator [Phytohabitans suffuscus]|uniref:LysR family transcriptional regulator n=1 Tax=Phytohabitans suffuscus TaxID=624315 RepID=A0A6F8Y9J3_9ACTN|nr:LysR family transcriptional regulator [Phytohabitans suffuscus]BCB82699.1 LysR family transcriptional regulator [Phytohabitans suffuscus]
MIDTWTLRVLVEVADRGSFSAAGEALSMTQPAVSRQIGGLERRLGVPLFRRLPRGVRLTHAGGAAVELARDILTRMHALEARLYAFTSLTAGQLNVSAFPSANARLTPEAIRRFAAAHPGVAVSLVRPDAAGSLPAVRDGRIDVALVTSWELYADPSRAKHDPSVPSLNEEMLDGIDLVPLGDERLHVVLPADHPLARRKRVPLRQLRDERWIEGDFPDCLGPIPPIADALGGPPRIGFFCDDWNGKQALVAARAGVMLVPTLTQAVLRPDLVSRPTTPALPPRRLYAAAAAPPFRAPAATAMIAILSAVCRQPVDS